MLARPDDLEQQIKMLPSILAPTVPLFPSKARTAHKKARAAIAEAEAVYARAAKRHPPQQWETVHPDVVSAEQAVAVARADGDRCCAAFRDAIMKREAAFAADVCQQLDRAAPALVALCRLMESGLEPLVDLQRTASLNNLPLPYALGNVPDIAAGLNALRRLLHRLG